jgi:hypothetical protein
MTSRKRANIKTNGYIKKINDSEMYRLFCRQNSVYACPFVCVCIYVCMYVKQRLSADTGRNTLSRMFNKLQIKAGTFQ